MKILKCSLLFILVFISFTLIQDKAFSLPADSGTGIVTSSDFATNYYHYAGGGGSTYPVLNDDYPFMFRFIKDENNRFWVFYPRNVSNVIHWSYKNSLDLVTWSAPADIGGYFTQDAIFQVWTIQGGALNLDYDPTGQGVIYAGITIRNNNGGINPTGTSTNMAKGIIAGTTITWSQVQSDATKTTDNSWGSGIAIDTTLHYNSSAVMHAPYTATPKQLVFTEDNLWGCCNPSSFKFFTSTAIDTNYGGTSIVALSNHQYLYILQNTTTLMFKASDPLGIAKSWGSTYTLGYTDSVKTAFAITAGHTKSNAYVVFINNTNLYFVNVTVSSSKIITFSTETLLKTGIGTNRPAIFYNNETGDIHVFYSKSNRIFDKQYSYSSGTWLDEYMLIDTSAYGGLVGTNTFNTGKDTDNFIIVGFRTIENSSKTYRLIWFKGLLTNTTSTLEGKLCGNTIGEINSTITTVSKLTSIMCIGDFQTGAIINRTGFVIHNYTNPFMSAWATLSIYMGGDGAIISNEHPLKLVWQKTYEVRNNTNNLRVEYYPNLFIPDHNFVAVAFSSTEDIGMNTTVNTNTQFTVNQYAPTTISFIQSTTDKVMLYAYWYRQNVTFAGNNAFTVETTSFIPIPSQILAFWISVGMPPQAGGFIILIVGIIMLAIVVLTKGVDEPEKVIGILGITAILCASAVNLIPVEIGIAVMIFVAAYFAMKIYSRMAGGSGE